MHFDSCIERVVSTGDIGISHQPDSCSISK